MNSATFRGLCDFVATSGPGSGCQACDPNVPWPQRIKAVLCAECVRAWPAGHALSSLHALAQRRVALRIEIPKTYAAL